MEHFTLTDSICTKKNGVSSSLLLLFVEQISSIHREDCSNSLTHLVFLEHFMFVCLILHFKKVGKKLEIIDQISTIHESTKWTPGFVWIVCNGVEAFHRIVVKVVKHFKHSIKFGKCI